MPITVMSTCRRSLFGFQLSKSEKGISILISGKGDAGLVVSRDKPIDSEIRTKVDFIKTRLADYVLI